MPTPVDDNVDPAELGKFSALASRWWDPDGPCKPLHDLNSCRHGFVASRVRLEGARVLDVGCGGGILAESLAASGAEVVGIDANAALIDTARAHSRYSNLSYVHALVEDDDVVPGQRFDVITCMELLEHVPDPARLLDACARRLTADGHVFVSTLNRTPRAYVAAILGAEYVLRLLPRGTHDYTRFIRPSELARWGRAADLDVVELAGLSYNPYTRRARLTRDVAVNFLAHLSRRP